jgi:hypothetical protein
VSRYEQLGQLSNTAEQRYSLFGNLLTGVVLANTQKAPARSRKIIAVGLIKLLSKSDATLAEPNVKQWYVSKC